MKLRNPWIDPRVARLRPEDVQSYLTRHGWKEAGPAENRAKRLFLTKAAGHFRKLLGGMYR